MNHEKIELALRKSSCCFSFIMMITEKHVFPRLGLTRKRRKNLSAPVLGNSNTISIVDVSIDGLIV
jgi:hypothetical protein